MIDDDNNVSIGRFMEKKTDMNVMCTSDKLTETAKDKIPLTLHVISVWLVLTLNETKLNSI